MSSSSSSSYSQVPISGCDAASGHDSTATQEPKCTQDTTSSQDPVSSNIPLTSAAKVHRIVQKWLKLNTGLKELSRHLCHLRWAIEELRGVLNSAFDPLGINIDAQENGSDNEAKDEVAVEGDKKTDTPLMTQAGGFHVSTGPELDSEQWADFTGCWKAHGSDRQS